MSSIKFELKGRNQGVYDSLRFIYQGNVVKDIGIDKFLAVADEGLPDFIYRNKPFILSRELLFVADISKDPCKYLEGKVKVYIGNKELYLDKLQAVKLLYEAFLCCMTLFKSRMTVNQYLYHSYGSWFLDPNLGYALLNKEQGLLHQGLPVYGYDVECFQKLINNLQIQEINLNTVTSFLRYITAGDILKRIRWLMNFGKARDYYYFYNLEAQCLGIGDFPTLDKVIDAMAIETDYIARTYHLTEDNAIKIFAWALLRNISPKDMIYLINQTI